MGPLLYSVEQQGSTKLPLLQNRCCIRRCVHSLINNVDGARKITETARFTYVGLQLSFITKFPVTAPTFVPACVYARLPFFYCTASGPRSEVWLYPPPAPSLALNPPLPEPQLHPTGLLSGLRDKPGSPPSLHPYQLPIVPWNIPSLP